MFFLFALSSGCISLDKYFFDSFLHKDIIIIIIIILNIQIKSCYK